MRKVIGLMLTSRKFVALFTATISSVIALLLAHFFGEAKAQQLAEQLSMLFVIGASIYAGSTAYEDGQAKAHPVEAKPEEAPENS